MSRMIVLFFSMGLALSHPSWAGDARGNGGHGIVCRDPNQNVTSVELLDFYEAREYRGIHRDLGPKTLTVDAKVKLALNRIGRFEFRNIRYQKIAANFDKNALFKSGVTLVNVPDTNHLAFPKGCSVEQIINQRKPLFPEDKLYLINADLWNLLDNDNKAGFILHEVIFEELLESGHTTSVGTRYYNSYITSNKLDQMYDRGPYIEFLRRTGFKDLWWHELPLLLPDPILCSEGCPLKRPILHGEISKVTHVYIGPHGPTNWFYSMFITPSCSVRLFANGSIAEGCFLIGDDKVLVGNQWLPSGEPLHLWFDENHYIVGRDLNPKAQNNIEVGLSGWLLAKGRLENYPTGQVRRLQLDGDQTITTANGPLKLIGHTIIEFNIMGMALSWFVPK